MASVLVNEISAAKAAFVWNFLLYTTENMLPCAQGHLVAPL